ncbi:MAG: twin-arginine translocase subunit TatC [Candidatus Baltobacteraceae bacterium]
MLAERPPQVEPTKPGWDQKEMPFTEHLRELRNRLIVSLTTVGVLALGLFWPSQFVIRWLKTEYLPPNINLHAFAPTDVIFTEFKFSLYGALVLGLPVLIFQAWMFVVPAIHPKTRRAVYGYIAPAFLLALAGIAFCHFFIIRRVIGALILITGEIAESTFGIAPTMNLILLTFLAFALIFQTPVVMVALARIGLVNVRMLRTYRRYAAMGILLLGGLAAPDASPITMLLIAVPMYALYEISIWLIVLLEKSWRRQGAGA